MKAIITRNDQTAVLELPTSRMEIAGSLNQIGVRTPAHIIPCFPNTSVAVPRNPVWQSVTEEERNSSILRVSNPPSNLHWNGWAQTASTIATFK